MEKTYFISGVFRFLTKKRVVYPAIILIIILGAVAIFRDGNGRELSVVVRADIIQEVAATGKVKPAQTVDLGFDKSGRVSAVYFDVGDSVSRGEVIASLESADLFADIAKAKASLEEETIKLREIKNTAPVSYNNSYKNLDAALREGFASADNAVRNRADQFFKTSPENPQFEVTFTDGNYVHYFDVPFNAEIELNNGRREVEDILVNWQTELNTINESNVLSIASASINNLNKISVFLDTVASAINTFTPAEYAYETTVTTYKTTISAARSEVSAAVSRVVTAKDKFNTAPALDQGGQFDSVLTQEARVAQARANVASLEATLKKSSIVAPFGGIVTLQEAKVGGAISAGAALVSIASKNEMYIEANISEINVGKIIEGNPVTVLFDAFPGETFTGTLVFIEPGDVIVEGVVNYKIRVEVANPDPRIKKGLTANLKIQTAKKSGVTALPLYAIVKEGEQNFVNKVVGKQTQKVPVTLGLVGNNGFAEILSGLTEGDTVEF